jgi:hypothetical protein
MAGAAAQQNDDDEQHDAPIDDDVQPKRRRVVVGRLTYKLQIAPHLTTPPPATRADCATVQRTADGGCPCRCRFNNELESAHGDRQPRPGCTLDLVDKSAGDGMTLDEIGVALGMSHQAVTQLLERTLDRLGLQCALDNFDDDREVASATDLYALAAEDAR